MPKKKYDLPKGLQNKPAGSENWYQVFYKKDRQPTIKWVRLDAHDLKGAKIERERLLRTYELNLFDPWEEKKGAQTKKDPKLKEAINSYLEAHAGLAKATCQSQRSALTKFMETIKRGHQRRLRRITSEDVEYFIDGATSHFKETSKILRLNQLSTFFSWCQTSGLTEENPALLYKGQRARGRSRYDRRLSRGQARMALMPDDFRRLISAVGLSCHGYIIDVFEFALATGLRRGELSHLNRRDVHLDAPMSTSGDGMAYPVTGRIRVRCWDNPRSGESFRTKTGKDRVLPLCPLAARIAYRHMVQHQTEDEWQPLFRTPQGKRYYRNRLSELFALYRDSVGFTGRVTLHSLRHSYASYLMMLGVNLFSIARLMGHASLDQLDTYAEMCEEYLMGDARPIQRRMLTLLCPDLSPEMVERILPSRRSLVSALSDKRFGHVQSLHAAIPMEEVLFGGICYVEASGHVSQGAPSVFLETF